MSWARLLLLLSQQNGSHTGSSAAAPSVLSRLSQGTFCSPTRISTCTVQSGHRLVGQVCVAALLRFCSA